VEETANVKGILTEVFEQNSQVLMISLSTPEDAGITNRYSALAGASTSLGDRTLSTLSQESARLIHIQGESRDIAISVSEKIIILVITEPSGSANLLADKLTNVLKTSI
jgi:predicted regulator of Ras-like GTPase activity (Roadblock/LC7/MglB family)